MAITKKALDFSEISNPTSANKVSSHAIRKSFEYDSFDGKTAFVAIVLTNPIGVNATDMLEPGSNIAAEVYEFAGIQGTERKVGRFQFRARILGANSPHTFIPNPCESLEFSIQTQGDEYEQTRQKLVSMHTMFYTTNDFTVNAGRVIPAPGDFVEVFLDKSDHGFDLQRGRYNGTIVNKKDVMRNLAGMEIPYALVGSGPRMAFDNPVLAGQMTPLQFLGNVGMPYEGNAQITSNWQAPGQLRDRGSIDGQPARRHGGTDMALPQGTPIYAVADGEVIASSYTTGNKNGKFKEGGLGGRITIKHKEKDYQLDPGKNVFSKYGHLSVLKVKSGQVKAGQLIGLSGGEKGKKGTGSSSGPHLHMEIWVGSTWNHGADPYGIPPSVDSVNYTAIYSIDFFEWLEQAQRQSGQPVKIAAANSKNNSTSTQAQDTHTDEGRNVSSTPGQSIGALGSSKL